LLAVFIDAIGSFLTIKKLAKDRASETRAPWMLAIGSTTLAILSLNKFSLENLLFPAYVLIVATIIIIMVKSPAKIAEKDIQKS